MKEITIIGYKYNELSGYKYNELSEKVQRNLKEKIVHSWKYMDDFNSELQDIICDNFPNSDLKVQWSLNCCQGDGVNLYGVLDYRDAIEFIKKMQRDKLDEDFIRIVKFCDIDFKLPENPRYACCYISNADVAIDMISKYEAITDGEPPAFVQTTARRFESVLIECLEDFCKEMENYGYDYFSADHIDDEYAASFYDNTIFISSGIDIDKILR